MTMATTGKKRKSSLAGVLIKIGNPFVSALLRSPAHSLLSGKFMLISVTGRKSGRTYTTPVNYVREGDEMTVISRRGRAWWRNLADPAPVLVQLRGKRQAGVAQVLALDGPGLVEAVNGFYAKMGLHPDPAKIESSAAECVVVRVELEGKR